LYIISYCTIVKINW